MDNCDRMYVFHFSWPQTNVGQFPSTTTVRMMPRWDPTRRPLIQGLKTFIRSDFAGTIQNGWGSPMVGWRQRVVATAIATSCYNLILIWGRFNLERCFHQTGAAFEPCRLFYRWSWLVSTQPFLCLQTYVSGGHTALRAFSWFASKLSFEMAKNCW